MPADPASPPDRPLPARESRNGTSEGRAGRDGPLSGPAWDEEFLREIDRIQGALTSQGDTQDPSAGHRAPTPDWREDEPVRTEESERWGAPSPYLEERLNTARGVAARLSADAVRVEEEVSSLKAALATIDRELGRAAEELAFERSQRSAVPPSEVKPRPAPPAPASPDPAKRVAVRGPGLNPAPAKEASWVPLTGSYPDFTVGRYNETVSALHARRRSIGWGTVVVAVGISALLLVLTLRADEPLPVIWLAVLPLVWMIPVPFFLAAFRGTQRVLKKNRLELPEEP